MAAVRDETLPIRSSDDIVRIRQGVRAYAIEAGFSLVDQTKIVTAASELARNTLDYGGGGDASLQLLDRDGRMGVRVIFEDNGPGIADIKLAMTDGYTSGGGTRSGTERRETTFQRVRDPLGPR